MSDGSAEEEIRRRRIGEEGEGKEERRRGWEERTCGACREACRDTHTIIGQLAI
jgi:hypothetical protein